MDNLILNENRLLTEEGIRHFTILASRTTRYLGNVLVPLSEGRVDPEIFGIIEKEAASIVAGML